MESVQVPVLAFGTRVMLEGDTTPWVVCWSTVDGKHRRATVALFSEEAFTEAMSMVSVATEPKARQWVLCDCGARITPSPTATIMCHCGKLYPPTT